MRSPDTSFFLSFLAPKGAELPTAAFIDGCRIRFTPPLVKISAPSRQIAFEGASRLLRRICRGMPPMSIAATLVSPPPISGSDSWSIAVGADVAFAPTSLGHEFPKAGA